jgi:hypothetical protein
MAGSHTASDDRLFMAALVVAVWLASFAAISLLFSRGQRAAPTPPPALPAEPAVTPTATLPPTVVTAGRADAYDCGPGSDGRPRERRCVPVAAHHEPARDGGRGPAP